MVSYFKVFIIFLWKKSTFYFHRFQNRLKFFFFPFLSIEFNDIILYKIDFPFFLFIKIVFLSVPNQIRDFTFRDEYKSSVLERNTNL
jgi:hypothetical protein